MKDYALLDAQLTETERFVRDSVRRFVDEVARPALPKAYEQGVFPTEFIRHCAELGLLGSFLPAEYGGVEANSVMYGLICQELERGDSGLRSFVSVQSSLCMYPIFRFGSDAQKQKWLLPMSQGHVIGCFGLTEPDAGSDPSSMQTTAHKTASGWRLNGTKMWITNAPIADIAIVFAKTEQGIRGFIVEKEREGFQAIPIKNKASLRASETGELVLTDCEIPAENLLPGTEKGLGAALSCLTQARFGIAWGVMGAAMNCFETALDYTRERKQFGKPVAAFQLVQKDLADMATEIIKTHCFNLHLAHLRDQKALHPAMVSMAKMNACREALNIARKARNLLGANGISLEYPIIRHLCNLESVFTYEGTDNIHHLIVGKHLTGLEAFS